MEQDVQCCQVAYQIGLRFVLGNRRVLRIEAMVRQGAFRGRADLRAGIKGGNWPGSGCFRMILSKGFRIRSGYREQTRPFCPSISGPLGPGL